MSVHYINIILCALYRSSRSFSVAPTSEVGVLFKLLPSPSSSSPSLTLESRFEREVGIIVLDVSPFPNALNLKVCKERGS